MGPDGMHPQVLRELVEAIARPLSIIFGKPWASGEVPKDWGKEMLILSSKRARRTWVTIDWLTSPPSLVR